MRKLFTILFFALACQQSYAQISTTITVAGDGDKFYPVTFTDPGWDLNTPTELSIGRSNIHTDYSWIGTIMADFKYHTNNYGHLSAFIDVNLRNTSSPLLIAGWVDGTDANASKNIIVWLKGGGLSYYINSPLNVSAMVYDGVQNALPFQEINGPARTFKTAAEAYVNRNGLNISGTAFFGGGGYNFINGNLGIGIMTPSEKLAVNGNIRAKEIKVETSNWPDYVFDENYKVLGLQELDAYIKANKHLPEMPSAKEADVNGIELGEMNKLLLKKVEELTLHLIVKDNEIKLERATNAEQNERLKKLELIFKKP